MPRDADRHLIFGLFALQNGLITHDQLLGGFRAWTLDKARPIADHLAGLGHIDARRIAAVEAMVALHIEDHGGDPEKSLTAMGVGPSTAKRLAGLADTDLHDSLTILSPGLPAVDPDRTATLAQGQATSDGRRFRFLRPHAKGGLGEVSVALDAELNREVALKEILERHADDPGSRSRFLLEAEITGGLEHPGIVPVYGLGTYADGRPYYAMRFIRGDTLKDAINAFHADATLQADPGRRSLALRRLLRRFTDVCNAVEYAHSRGVLHRDLKPANVILGRHGETLVVDWGLAKATGEVDLDQESPESRLTPSTSGDSSAETLPGQAIGTPAFMSPEQAAGRLELIGPRSDVYGLGATLYYLLTNRAPFASNDLALIFRSIDRGDFPRPRALSPSIDPALEAITLQSMSLDRADRYPSARALAEDIERWTAEEPVRAWREPFPRRARRWMRRNRVLVTAASAALLVAALGLGVISAVQAKANRELKLANRLKDQANRDLQAAIEGETTANRDLKLANERVEARFDLARDAIKTYSAGVQEDDLLKNESLKPLRDKLLRSAAGFYEKLEKLLQNQADGKSRATLAQAYMDLGQLIVAIGVQPEALAAYRKALAIRRDLATAPEAGARSQFDMASSLQAVGSLASDTGDLTSGVKDTTEACQIFGRLTRADPHVVEYQSRLAECYNNIGSVLSDTGDSAGALRSYGEALAIQSRLAQANPTVIEHQDSLAGSHNNIGFELAKKGDTAGSLQSYREALSIRSRLVQANPSKIEYQAGLANSHNSLGTLLSDNGDRAGALRSYGEALTIRSRLAQANPAITEHQADLARSHNNISLLLSEMGDTAGALRSRREALAIRSRLVDTNPSVTQYQSNLANSHNSIGALLSSIGDSVGALRSYSEALTIQSRLAQANPTVTEHQVGLSICHNNIGALLLKTGDPDGALRSLRKAKVIRSHLVETNPDVTEYQSKLATSYNNIAHLLSDTGDEAGALQSHRDALAIRARLADSHPSVTEYQTDLASSHLNIGSLLADTGDTARALRAYGEALTIQSRLAQANLTVSEFQADLARTHNDIGHLMLQTGDTAGSLRSHREALGIRSRLAEANPTISDYQARLASSHNNLGSALSAAGDGVGSLRSHREAWLIQTRLFEVNPSVAEYHSDVAISLHNIASELARAGDVVGSLRTYGDAILIWEELALKHSKILSYRTRLATSLLALGVLHARQTKPVEAIEQFRRAVIVLEALPAKPSHVYRATKARSQIVMAGRMPGSGMSAERVARESEDAAEALRRAIAVGYHNLRTLKTDPDLNPIRDRADVQLMLMDLAFPSLPFAEGP